MPSKTPEMDRCGEAIHRYLATGEVPGARIGAQFRTTWEAHLASLPRGVSANHSLLWAVVGYIRGDEDARRYLLARVNYELRRGLGLTEQESATYWPLHLGPWSVVAIVASWREDAELYSLVAAWLERACLLASLTTIVVPGKGWASVSPGMRCDAGSLDYLRLLVAAILGEILGSPQPWDRQGANPPPAVSILWGLRAVRPYGLAGITSRVSDLCKGLIRNKRIPITPQADKIIDQIRLYQPMTWLSYSDHPQHFAACIGAGEHGQDPPALAVHSKGGWPRVEYLYPFTGQDPPEEGWSAKLKADEAPDGTLTWTGRWKRGEDVTVSVMEVPKPQGVRVIGAGPEAGTLDNLPEDRVGYIGQPWVGGAGRQEEPPVDEPGDEGDPTKPGSEGLEDPDELSWQDLSAPGQRRRTLVLVKRALQVAWGSGDLSGLRAEADKWWKSHNQDQEAS